jgi:hypothetical protein
VRAASTEEKGVAYGGLTVRSQGGDSASPKTSEVGVFLTLGGGEGHHQRRREGEVCSGVDESA